MHKMSIQTKWVYKQLKMKKASRSGICKTKYHNGVSIWKGNNSS